VALTGPGVTDVQLALWDHGQPDETMQVRLRTGSDAPSDVADLVHRGLLSQVYRLRSVVALRPASLRVDVVDQFAVNERTRKTPLVVYERHGEPAA
jgi:phenylacetate-CoA ligase